MPIVKKASKWYNNRGIKMSETFYFYFVLKTVLYRAVFLLHSKGLNILTAKTQIQYINLSEIVPYVNNPRNNEDAVDKIASSIKEYGFNVPIVLDSDNVIICGHTRYLASKKLGIDEIPCIYANHLTPAQVKAYRIADNKTSEFAKWEDDLLAIELEQLQELNYDLDLTGFEDWETEHLLNPVSDEDLQEFFVDRELKEKKPKKIKCPECGCEFEK